MPERRPKRITVQFLGPDRDRGHLHLPDFIRKLDELRRALRQTVRTATGADDPGVYWRIVDLRHDSPSTVVLEEVWTDERVKPRASVSALFTSNLKQINKTATIPDQERDLDVLEAYKAFGVLSDQGVKKVQVRAGGRSVSITPKFLENLDKIIGPDEIEHGTVSGMLDAINIHDKLRCNIYPIVGPKRVAGTFPTALKAKIIDGIGRYVEATGILKYKQWSMLPHAIDITDVEIMPADADLPTLADLRGSAPDATGDLSSEDFIEAIREDAGW